MQIHFSVTWAEAIMKLISLFMFMPHSSILQLPSRVIYEMYTWKRIAFLLKILSSFSYKQEKKNPNSVSRIHNTHDLGHAQGSDLMCLVAHFHPVSVSQHYQVISSLKGVRSLLCPQVCSSCFCFVFFCLLILEIDYLSIGVSYW